MADSPATTEVVNPVQLSQGEYTPVAGDGVEAVVENGAEEATEARQSSIFDNWLLYAAIGLWVWWLLTNKKRKNQREQEKKEKERRDNLVKGDHLVTIGRLHGSVVAFTDDTVTIHPDGNRSDINLIFDRQAILKVLPRPSDEDAAADGDGKPA
ncbi:MAG: preprotein translocase subunit YajC [Planctomycetota bacterium]|jgi:preprotein translocase subunit YajC|nr:preprotein translocase subunit YajC [Planctomycetota bacterium]